VLYVAKPIASADYSWMVNNFYRDSHQRLWVATNRGIYLVKEDLSGFQQQFTHEPHINTSIADNAVRNVHEDKEGNLWLATDNGISIGSPYGQRFGNMSLNVLKAYPFADKHVSAIIVVDSTTLLVCTYGADGIYETDIQFRVKNHYSFNSNDYDWVWEFYQDQKNDQVFISTQKGMLLYDSKAHTIKKLATAPFDNFFPVTAFLPGDNGKIWMSRYSNEFIEYDPALMKFTRHHLKDYNISPQQMKLAKDADGHLWILGNSSGLYQVDPETKKIQEKIAHEKSNINSLRQPEVIFFKDLGKHLFLGYDQKGFSLFDKKSKHFQHYYRSEGLSGNRVNDAWNYNDGNIWIATSNGISSLNMASGQLVSYNYDDGILNNNVFFITQLPTGLLAAGTAKGVLLFDPQQVKIQAKLAAPIITDISVYGKQMKADSLLETGESLYISHQENYFSLNYISLQFSHQQQVEYAYMLEGFDKDWIEAGNRRFTSYANMQGGKYIFRLKARLPGGSWIESKTPLALHVATVFYKRWWFIPFCALVLLGLFYALFRYRLRQLIKLERMRSAISSDLHDEVGATLSSISIFSEMAKQNIPADSKAAPYLQRIGDRSRDSIEKMSDIIWSINPANDSLQEMLSRMKTFVNENVEGRDIDIHWQQSESIGSLRLGMMQRKNFYLLFKEAIINAVKYADANAISVEIAANGKIVSLSITDDGKGFNFDDIKPGNGIKNIRHRAIQLNGIALIESSPGKGTKVFVEFKN
jgi:ligand-binding sensor domain-containing protein/two-component sensor histidine kinase